MAENEFSESDSLREARKADGESGSAHAVGALSATGWQITYRYPAYSDSMRRFKPVRKPRLRRVLRQLFSEPVPIHSPWHRW